MAATVSAFISARTQSTRVPDKMLRPFAGTSLIDIALAKLDQLGNVEHRCFAVAEDALAERARGLKNVEVVRRVPESAAKGDAPMAVRYIHYANCQTDYLLIVNSCHPFLKVETLERAVEEARRTGLNSYTSAETSVDWLFDQDGRALTNTDPRVVSTTQSKKFYRAAHAFHIIRPAFLREQGVLWTFQPQDPGLIPIDEEDALDIDTMVQFEMCEALYEKRHCANPGAGRH